MITPPPYYDTSDQDIVNTIKSAIENGEHNLYVWMKGCVDKQRLYDFVKGIYNITLTIITINYYYFYYFYYFYYYYYCYYINHHFI